MELRIRVFEKLFDEFLVFKVSDLSYYLIFTKLYLTTV